MPNRWVTMRGQRFITAALIVFSALGWTTLGTSAQGARRLVSEAQARHLGLERAWFAQVRLDRARNRVERAVLEGDRSNFRTIFYAHEVATMRRIVEGHDGDEGFADVRSVAQEHAHRASRYPAFLEESHQKEARTRSFEGWLQDDRAPSDDGRYDLPDWR
jgi:hypothetical protein